MRAAQDEAGWSSTVWRLRYNLPPTDPRYLDATEEEIDRDLLVLTFHGEELRKIADPGAAQAEQLAADPQAAARLLRRKSEAMRDAALAAGLRALGIGAKTEPAPPPGRIRIRVGRDKKPAGDR